MSDNKTPASTNIFMKILGAIVIVTCTPVGLIVIFLWMALMAAGVIPSASKSSSPSTYDDYPSQQVYTPRGDW